MPYRRPKRGVPEYLLPFEPVSLNEEDIITVDFPEDLRLEWITQERIDGTVRNGQGRVRRTREEREETRDEDQATGLICLAGFSLYVTGGMELFMCSRILQEIDPFTSDGGEDVPGYPIDVKGQLVRDYHEGFDDIIWEKASSYHLPVREMHRGNGWPCTS